MKEKKEKENKKVAMSQQNGQGIRSILLKGKEAAEKLLRKRRGGASCFPCRYK